MLIRVVLADDHSAYRETLHRVLDSYPYIAVLGEACSGTEAIQLVQELHPDVALVDVRMKDMNGIDAVAAMLAGSPHTAVLMLSVYDDKRYVTRAVRAGAKGYLLKDAATEILLDAIQAAYAGRYYFSPGVSEFADAAMRAAGTASR
jgi:DNA-binding NarL/FixJ family response regulator